MRINELLARLQRLDVHLAVDGDRLRVDAPSGAVDAELRALLSAHKSALIAALVAGVPPATSDGTTNGTTTEGAVIDTHVADSLRASGLSDRVYHRLAARTSTWRGPRDAPGSLIFGRHTDGSAPPVFWCLQALPELDSISRHLGPDQPIYAMRSGHLVMDKTRENVAALGRYYANEILRIRPGGPYTIFGTCQGADIALAIAVYLGERGHPIQLLGLHEKFIPNPYPGRVALFFGRRSSRNPYLYQPQPERAWHRFYGGQVDGYITDGKHTQAFREPHVRSLADCVKQALAVEQAAAPAPASNRVSPSMPASACQAEIRLQSPAKIARGAPLVITAHITNTSPTTWTTSGPDAVQAGYCAYGVGRQYCIDAERGFALEPPAGANPIAVLAPGASTTLRFTMRAPQRLGVFRLEVDLLDDRGNWFRTHGGTAGTTHIRVTRRLLPLAAKTGMVLPVPSAVLPRVIR